MVGLPRLHRLSLLLVVMVGAARCRTQANRFYQNTFRCDPTATGDQCGTTRAGAPMVCFSGQSIGSISFCAEWCDPRPAPDPDFVCASANGSIGHPSVGARLRVCDPSPAASSSPTGGGCPIGFACRAMDAGNKKGLCLPPCTADDHCQDNPSSCDSDQGDIGCAQAGAGIGLGETCFDARQLRGTDFCAPKCNPAQGSPDPARFVCLESGALLQICQPHASEADPAVGCPPQFGCLRTRLQEDRGVCIATTNLCQCDADCHGSTYTTCAGSLIRELITNPLLAGIAATDHLQCLKKGCKSNGCAEGSETCYGKEFGGAGPIGDICVPNCDSRHHCPPSFSCGTIVSGNGTGDICLPGLPGGRCSGQESCIAGTCQDTGAGFNVCTFDCTSDDTCQFLSGGPGRPFLCVHAPADGQPPATDAMAPLGHKHCVDPIPFHGSNCSPGPDPACLDHGKTCWTDCLDAPDGHLQCFLYGPATNPSVAGNSKVHGECRLPCDANHRCPKRGGLPHVCLAEGTGGCFPGILGLPCHDSDECLPGLMCMDQVPNDDPGAPPGDIKICTVPCGRDADCDDNQHTNQGGYCVVPGADPHNDADRGPDAGPPPGFCHIGRFQGAPCERGAQCASRCCDVQVSGTCVDACGT